MTSFDYFVLIVVASSILLSVLRGFVKELISIIAWVLAFVVAKLYTVELAILLPDSLTNDSLRYLAAFLILFLSTLLICTLLGIALSEVFKIAGMGWLDRVLGGVFGCLRGIFVVVLIVMLCGLTSLPQQAAWRSALFSAPLEAMVVKILPMMPSVVAEKIRFD
jgi:membrane protein required for colicin V production